MSTVSETLNTAADLLQERGWARGNAGMLATDDAALCLEGGIAAGLGVTERDTWRETGESIYSYASVEGCPAYAAVRSYLGLRPYVWNDTVAKTAAEVIEVLRAAAVIEAARENESAAVGVSA